MSDTNTESLLYVDEAIQYFTELTGCANNRQAATYLNRWIEGDGEQNGGYIALGANLSRSEVNAAAESYLADWP